MMPDDKNDANKESRSGLRRRLDQYFQSVEASPLPFVAPERSVEDVTFTDGRIKLVRRIGGGSFGEVFVGCHCVLGHHVAVKIPRSNLASKVSVRSRFEVEVKSVSRLNHPAIANVFEFDVLQSSRDGELPYLVSEFCCGRDLATWMCDHRCDNLVAILRFTATLADAIDHAHARGVIHNDIKPANVLLRPKLAEAARLDNFDPLLTDFGLARLFGCADDETDDQCIIGTPLYMSPEQALGSVGDIGPASDIYGLAAVMVELMTGKPPRWADEYDELMKQLMLETPPPIDCRLDGFTDDHLAVCDRALARHPKDRYQRASDFAMDLRRIADDGRPTT